jgi:AraC-like DNA-binding protein
MRFQEFAVSDALVRYAEAIWTLSSGGRPAPRDAGFIVPDGCIEIVLSFGDPVRSTPRSRSLTRFVVGQMTRPFRLIYTGSVDVLAVRLRPSAGRTFLARDPCLLVNRVVNLENAAPELNARLARALTRDTPRRQRRAALQHQLADYATSAPHPDPLIERATTLIREHCGGGRIAEIARHLHVSPRQLQRRFERDVGLSPKRWSRIVRFQAAMSAPTQESAWSDRAAAFGYADQAHLSREFRELRGAPPTDAWWSSR